MKTREEMNPEFMWDFTHIYATREAWEEELRAIEEKNAEIGRFKGKLGESAAALADGLDAMYSLIERIERMFAYARLQKEADNGNAELQSMEARAMNALIAFGSETSYIQPEIVEIGEERIAEFLVTEPRLATYRFMLSDTMRSREHVLDAKSEELLAGLEDVFAAPSRCYDMLTDVDIEFPTVKDSAGNEIGLTHGTFGVCRESRDRVLRERAFTEFFGTYKKYINTFAATYGGAVKGDCALARIRGFGSACEAALFAGNVPVSVYDSLIEATHKALPSMKKYIELRAKTMGKERIDMFDLYTPMVEGVDIPMPYEDAKTLVKQALAPFGEEYAALLDRAYSEHWVDVYENKGKSSGAFSYGVYGVHPYVLLNYTDTLDDAYTLAHELGHAMHSYFSDREQDIVNHDYRIMVAEVASTVNEVMLTKYLLAHETDPLRRAYILNHFLEGFRTTGFRQTLFAEFERRAHDMCSAGTPLTAESLSDLYRELISLYYEGAEINDIMAYEWSFIPHFYRNFYVYQYSTGFYSAVDIAGRISAGEAPSGYLKFLTTGGSDYPIEELKIAGVDLTRPDTVANALRIFDETISELDALLDSLK